MLLSKATYSWLDQSRGRSPLEHCEVKGRCSRAQHLCRSYRGHTRDWTTDLAGPSPLAPLLIPFIIQPPRSYTVCFFSHMAGVDNVWNIRGEQWGTSDQFLVSMPTSGLDRILPHLRLWLHFSRSAWMAAEDWFSDIHVTVAGQGKWIRPQWTVWLLPPRIVSHWLWAVAHLFPSQALAFAPPTNRAATWQWCYHGNHKP